ncbi:MAG: hypothetical protein H6728_03460 [Myxococcales bacterium]|nr:hypothetical protein [Myxococcales bacterium]MCB9642108.1 hypothetical protein [Myxococcales bacterium]
MSLLPPAEERTLRVGERAKQDDTLGRLFSERVFPRWMQIILLILVSALVLVAVTLILFERKWFEPPSRQIDSYSRNAIGHRAFFEVLKKLKITPLRYRKEQGLANVQAPLFLIMPDLGGALTASSERFRRKEPSAKQNIQKEKEEMRERLQNALSKRINAGFQTVIVLPKWELVFSRRTRILEAKLLENSFVQHYLEQLLPKSFPKPQTDRDDHRGEQAWPRPKGESLTIDTPFAQFFRLKKESPWRVWLGQRDKAMVLSYTPKQAGSGTLWLIADPDPISNFRMQLADHSYIFYTLIRDALKTDTIVLDEVSHGHGKKFSLRDELARFPNILLSIHACLLLFLAAWLGWIRFGVPLVPKPHPLRGPKEVLAITSRVLADGKRRHALVASYILCLLEDTAQRLELKKGPLIQRCEAIDRWCEQRQIPAEAVDLYRRAMRLRGTEKKREVGTLRAAQSAWNLRKQILEKRWRTTRSR